MAQVEAEDPAIGGDGGAGGHDLLPRLQRRGQVLPARLAPAYRAAQQARGGGDGRGPRGSGMIFWPKPPPISGLSTVTCHSFRPSRPASGAAIGVRRLGPDPHGQVLPPIVPDARGRSAAPSAHGSAGAGRSAPPPPGRPGRRRRRAPAWRSAGGRRGCPAAQGRRAARPARPPRRWRRRPAATPRPPPRTPPHPPPRCGVSASTSATGSPTKRAAVQRQHRHLHRLQALDRRRHAERRHQPAEVLAGEHGGDARQGARGGGIDRTDAGMCVGAAEKHGVQAAWRVRDVVAETALAGQEAAVLPPAQGLSQDAAGPGRGGSCRQSLGHDACRAFAPDWRAFRIIASSRKFVATSPQANEGGTSRPMTPHPGALLHEPCGWAAWSSLAWR